MAQDLEFNKGAFRLTGLFVALLCMADAHGQFGARVSSSFISGPRRIPVVKPTTPLVSKRACLLTVDINVDRKGKVVVAKLQQESSNCTDTTLQSDVLDLARRYEFSEAATAPELQAGTIVWHFDVVLNVEAMDQPREAPVEETPPTYDFASVQEQPVFPGGMQEMDRFIMRTLRYPPEAADAKIQGKVYLEFVIARDGSVSEVLLKRGVHPSLDREAIRVVKAMPKWTPGTVNGRAVPVRMVQPIQFKL